MCADGKGKRLLPVAFDVAYGPDGLPTNFPPDQIALILAEHRCRARPARGDAQAPRRVCAKTPPFAAIPRPAAPLRCGPGAPARGLAAV